MVQPLLALWYDEGGSARTHFALVIGLFALAALLWLQAVGGLPAAREAAGYWTRRMQVFFGSRR